MDRMFAPLSEYGREAHKIHIHLSTPVKNKIKDENYSNMLLNWGKGSEEVLLKFKVFFPPNFPLFCVIEVQNCTHEFSVSHPV
jgi:hypothetical protein